MQVTFGGLNNETYLQLCLKTIFIVATIIATKIDTITETHPIITNTSNYHCCYHHNPP